MADPTSSRHEALCDFGRSLVAGATAEGIRARLLGGVGIEARIGGRPPALRRRLDDVDVLVHNRDAVRLERRFEVARLRPDVQFNALNGDRRQVWWSDDPATHVDVFVGRIVLCHELDFEDRLDCGDDLALDFGDLLLTKLQVVELTDKDAKDLLALLLADPSVSPIPSGELLDADRIARRCGSDWGLYTTATDNLARLPELAAQLGLPSEQATVVAARSRELSSVLAAAPKSMRWRARAKIGRTVRWYQLPEESLTNDLTTSTGNSRCR